MTAQDGQPIVLQGGDIVQIKPEHDKTFGYFDVPGQGRAYYRAAHSEMVKVGKCEWLPL